MRLQRITRSLFYICATLLFLVLLWQYSTYFKESARLSHNQPTGNEDDSRLRLLAHFEDDVLSKSSHFLENKKEKEKENEKNTVAGEKTQPKIKSARVDMIRDTAKDIKWSADKDFELNLIKRCSAKSYDLTSLPNASIIICFHGSETLTRLLHTIHSIVQQSPPELLHEIILLADNTNTESHHYPLEQYVKFIFPGLVWIHRSTSQLGLIKCRQLGATLATGEVIISMDSHMELRTGWLEPLVYEIRRNRQTMATPFLDWMTQMDDGSWQYEYGCSRYKTVWYWKDMGFTFMEIPYELKGVIDPTKPITSAVSVGTVWAMDRNFFFEIGGLDEGMTLWGGENIDLPIRAVLAGGRHVNVPCSHAAHCAPKGSRDYRIGHKPEVNYKRVIEALFTPEYKDTIYYYNPHWKDVKIGDISSRKALAETFKHNFSYYMEHADPEHLAPYVNTLAWDGVKNVGVSQSSPSSCMYIDFSDWLIKLTQCQDFDRHVAGLFLTNEGEIHSSNHIIMSRLVDDSLTIGNYVGVINTSQVDRWMHKKSGVIQWYSHPKRSQREFGPRLHKCISVINYEKQSAKLAKVSLRHCNYTDPFQQWQFGKYTKAYTNLVDNSVFPGYQHTEDSRTFYKAYTSFLNSYGLKS